MKGNFKIVTFYGFTPIEETGPLDDLRAAIRSELTDLGIKGTLILATEGFNSTLAGLPAQIDESLTILKELLNVQFNVRTTYCSSLPFRRLFIKIKPEIVTLKKPVEIAKGVGTHVAPDRWNALISEKGVVVLDTRNDYECRSGTFEGAINPMTEKFSDLPDYVARNLDPQRHKRIAVFCTGGVRCEKFAPYLIDQGFSEVYQLEGGILGYLAAISGEESLWRGECFVFDDRITVSEDLAKGTLPDLSQREVAE
ncbi:MAG TPA: rhodanese-like domain-containing protein [Pyrinomonadaceae bacterium]|nr:rhodanese-like domain-containing protein [Pyrinomonadaceae bacterium]HMP65723.1 rhodanese-like domain-containing protein [Pyrinomonadaceae bacterium]